MQHAFPAGEVMAQVSPACGGMNAEQAESDLQAQEDLYQMAVLQQISGLVLKMTPRNRHNSVLCMLNFILCIFPAQLKTRLRGLQFIYKGSVWV